MTWTLKRLSRSLFRSVGGYNIFSGERVWVEGEEGEGKGESGKLCHGCIACFCSVSGSFTHLEFCFFFFLASGFFSGFVWSMHIWEVYACFLLSILQQLGLQAEDGFVLKVVQLEELLVVRHSVFVIGGAGTGKSQVIICHLNLCCVRFLIRALDLRS